MEEEFDFSDFNMDSFNDSPIFEADGNGIEELQPEQVLSEFDNENLAKSFLGDDTPTEENEDNKDNIAPIEEEVPESVDEEENVEEGSEDDDDESDSSSNLYSSLASVIHEQGLLPSIDINKTDIKSVDDLALALRQEQEAQAQLLLDKYIAELDTKKLVDSVKDIKALNDVDANYLSSNIEYAKTLIRQDYKNQGLDDVKIDRIINRLVDLGEEDLIDESLKAKESIIEKNNKVIEEEKQRQIKARAEEEKQNIKIQETIKKRIFESDIIEGFRPTKAFRDKMYNTMTSIVGESPEGIPENAFMRARRENIIDFETRMYAFYELTNGFTDFSKLATPAKSQAIQNLEKAARGQILKNNTTPSYINDKESYFGSGDFSLNI